MDFHYSLRNSFLAETLLSPLVEEEPAS